MENKKEREWIGMKDFLRRHRVAGVFLFALALSLLLLLICSLSPAFSEWMARYPAAIVAYLLAAVTSPFPFSLFEILIGAACLYGVFLLGFTLFLLIKRAKKMPLPSHWPRFYFGLLAAADVVLVLFVFTFAPSYFRLPTAEHMGLDTGNVGEEEVFFALESLVEVMDKAAPFLETNEAGESLAPYSLSLVKEKVIAAADQFGKEHSFFRQGGFPAKEFLSSPLMTYTHIAGVYGFFTGEANINTNYPHFVVTSSLAHETCHARGIAPENECNFLAAVILMESDDPYLRYCGAMGIIDDFIAVAKRLDADRCSAILDKCPSVRRLDVLAYSRFFQPYRESPAAKVADSANSAYLKAMGQKEGTVSYSRIIRLVSAYFQAKCP